MSEDIRKIHIDTKDDFRYVRRCLQDAIANNIESEQSTGSDITDSEADHVKKYLTEWISSSFEKAQANFLVNGFSLTDIMSETVQYEPFDKNLYNKVSAIEAQKREKMTKVMQLRKSAPEIIESRILETATDKEVHIENTLRITEPNYDSLLNNIEAVAVNPEMELASLQKMYKEVQSDAENATETLQLVNSAFPPTETFKSDSSVLSLLSQSVSE